MQSTDESITEHSNNIELNALNWALMLLKKFPIETAIAEIKKYKEELKSEM